MTAVNMDTATLNEWNRLQRDFGIGNGHSASPSSGSNPVDLSTTSSPAFGMDKGKDTHLSE